MAKRNTSKGNPTKAIGYLRVSTDEQNLGPEAQRAAIETWGAREGVTIVGWYEDHGVSGGAPLEKRIGLMGAVDALAEHGAGVLVVAKRDRLARDVVAAAMVEQLVQRQGARVVSSAGEGTDGDVDDPNAALMRGLIDLFAQHERAVIRARTKAALAVKKSRGQRVGSVPFGFQLAKDGKMLVERECEQHVIRIARELRSAGMSLRAIGAELESRGLRARNGNGWAAPQIQRMVLSADN